MSGLACGAPEKAARYEPGRVVPDPDSRTPNVTQFNRTDRIGGHVQTDSWSWLATVSNVWG